MIPALYDPRLVVLGVLAAFVIALVALVIRWIRDRWFRQKPAGDSGGGVAMPTSKPPTRSLLQATYTPRLQHPVEKNMTGTRGLEKCALVNHLAPTPEELNDLTRYYSEKQSAVGGEGVVLAKALKTTGTILSAISPDGSINVLRNARQFAKLEPDILVRVAQDLIVFRQETLEHASALYESIQQASALTAVAPADTSPAMSAINVKQVMESAVSRDLEKDLALKTLALADSLSLRADKLAFPQFRALAANRLETLKDLVITNPLGSEPVGWLHLERLAFTPVGIERGELVYSVPLSPGEQVNIAHKEWSNTSEEFERIVTDYKEDYSEEGVTEKSELAQSTNSQNQHSSALNTGVSSSYSYSSAVYGSVNISATLGYTASDSASKTEQLTRNHSAETTRKASSRSKTEHKVSFKVASAAGTEDQTVRLIKNPFSDRATRVDYYQLLRKWRVDLYRYGIRLTWDIVIPEPGAGLLALLKEIEDIKAALELGIESKIQSANWPGFAMGPEQITKKNYSKLAGKFGASLTGEDIPPEVISPYSISPTLPPWEVKGGQTTSTTIEVQSGKITEAFITFVPAGAGTEMDQITVIDGTTGRTLYWGLKPSILLNYTWVSGAKWEDKYKTLLLAEQVPEAKIDEFILQSGQLWIEWPRKWTSGEWRIGGTTEVDCWIGKTGSFPLLIWYSHMVSLSLSCSFELQISDSAWRAWQLKVWTKIKDAAEARYQEMRTGLKARLARLEEQLGAQDALSLRKKEHDEVMKGVLRWMLGKKFGEYMVDTSVEAGLSEESIEGYFPDDYTRKEILKNGEYIKLLHHAVEWENLLYFLYPYFWSHPSSWEFRKYLDHPDFTHRAFLKAGAARIVLTIRPGFENAFLGFANTGNPDDIPPHPYLSIGDEFKAYASTNYPGIPPANPVESARPLLTLKQRRAWEDMQRIGNLLYEYRNRPKQRQARQELQTLSSLITQYYLEKGSYPGNLEILVDYFEEQNPNQPKINAVDPWERPYTYIYPGTHSAFELVCYGANGKPGGEGASADITADTEIPDFEYPTTAQGLACLQEYVKGVETVPTQDPWGNLYQYKCPGDHSDYDLVCYGADGKPGGEDENADITSWAEASLIGTWHEYTPTSALDIEFDQHMPKA